MSTKKKPKRKYLKSKLRVSNIALDILDRDEWRRGYFNTSDKEMMEEIFDRMKPKLKCIVAKAKYASERLQSETKFDNFPFIRRTIHKGCHSRTEYKIAA